jgi:hypothetical protein
MPDTGAPWNIPYVENADLVSDWPADSLLVANAVAAGLSAAQNAGIGSNVVQATKVDAFTTASTSFTDLTGLSVTITPTSNTSKILLLVQLSYSHSTTNQPTRFNLVRDSTDLFQSTDGTVRNATLNGVNFAMGNTHVAFGSITFLDSPATTSATTYKIQTTTTSGIVYVNRNGAATNDGSTSSITAIEVAA